MNLYDIAVVTPEKEFLRDRASFMILRSTAGDLGILHGHTPLITGVVPTAVDLRLEDGRRFIHVSGGFLEVRPERVTVLARTAEAAEDIDVERAEAARDRAKERLESREPDVDVRRAKQALARAEGRLRTVQAAREAT